MDPSSAGADVLFVDDDDDTREVISVILGSEGFDVCAVASAAEALEVMHNAPPRMVIVDIVMPAMSGLDMLERMRSDPDLAAVPAVVLSGRPQVDVDRLGVLAWLSKPVAPDDLIDTVHQLVD
jgi:CheY-like chemotaxis protein